MLPYRKLAVPPQEISLQHRRKELIDRLFIAMAGNPRENELWEAVHNRKRNVPLYAEFLHRRAAALADERMRQDKLEGGVSGV